VCEPQPSAIVLKLRNSAHPINSYLHYIFFQFTIPNTEALSDRRNHLPSLHFAELALTQLAVSSSISVCKVKTEVEVKSHTVRACTCGMLQRVACWFWVLHPLQTTWTRSSVSRQGFQAPTPSHFFSFLPTPAFSPPLPDSSTFWIPKACASRL
jgi:hypothetical protein